MAKSRFAIGSARIAVAIVPLVLAGCSAGVGENAANSNASNNSNGNEVQQVAKNEASLGSSFYNSNSSTDSSNLDNIEEIEEVNEGTPADVATQDADLIAEIKPGEIRDYAGWYRIAFPNEVSMEGGENFFECFSPQGFLYAAEIECARIDAEEFQNPDPAVPKSPIQIMAEHEGLTMGSPVITKPLGAYTWYLLRPTGTDIETYAYAEIAPNEYVEIWFQGLAPESSETDAVLASFSVLPGDPCQNSEVWASAYYDE